MTVAGQQEVTQTQDTAKRRLAKPVNNLPARFSARMAGEFIDLPGSDASHSVASEAKHASQFCVLATDFAIRRDDWIVESARPP